MAFGGRRDSPADVGADGDVMGRDRLAASKLGRTTGTCRLILSLRILSFYGIRSDF